MNFLKLNKIAKASVRPALVAFVVALGFPPLGFWPLTWLAFVYFFMPLLRDVERPDMKQTVFYITAYAFFVNISGFYWLSYTLKEFGGMPWVAAIPVMLFIFVLFSVYTAVLAFAWVKLARFLGSRFGKGVLYAAFFMWLLVWDTFDFRMFPWTPAMSVGSDRTLLASVYYLGTTGWRVIFFAWVLVVTLSYLSTQLTRRRRLSIMGGSTALVLLLGYGLGQRSLLVLGQKYSERQPVALLQGNVGNYEKKLTKLGVLPTVVNVMAIHQQLIEQVAIHYAPLYTQEKIAPETWVIWPETSFPGLPLVDGEMKRQLLEWTKLTRGLHMVGAYENTTMHFDGKDVYRDFNITAFFHEKAGVVGHAQKMLRIPFGEYIPFDETFPSLYGYFPQVNHFGAGREFRPLAHPDPAGPVFLPLVCYEILYSWFLDRYVAEAKKQFPGRSIIVVNPANDSWYGPTSEPFQHSLLARWATTRQGIASLRATNTGLTQIIAPWGEVLSSGPQDESTVIYGELPVEKTQMRSE